MRMGPARAGPAMGYNKDEKGCRRMTEHAYREFEASALYCARCRRAVAVRKKLLLILPTGAQYDYVCHECGSPVGSKLDQDPTEFRRTARAAGPPPLPTGPPRRRPL